MSDQNQKISFDPQKFIKLEPFLLYLMADLVFILVSFIIWRFLWVSTNRLKIKSLKNNQFYPINENAHIFEIISHVRMLIRNMRKPKNYITEKCGFEAYTFIYFEKGMTLILAILCITDLCLWIPYQLFFNPIDDFSLVKIPSKGNDVFRTFYTIWVASVILYNLYLMYDYLCQRLQFKLYHHGDDRILNNLKAKTLHVNFLGEKFYNEAQLKSAIQQYLVDEMGHEDRILAVLPIPNYSKHLQAEYRLKIIQIIEEIGIQNTSCCWKFFKAQNQEKIALIRQQTKIQMQRIINNTSQQIEGCYIIVSQMETAQQLCKQFEIQKVLYKICPQFVVPNQQQIDQEDNPVIVKWAQQPKDIMWINMTLHTQQICNFVLFNFLCVLLLGISFSFIGLGGLNLLPIPTLLQLLIFPSVNSTLRFLCSKMVQWQKKFFRSQQQIKLFKILGIYFFTNLLIGSILRDSLHLQTVLETGWGFIQLLKLLYMKIDGYLYYLIIFNQTAISFMDTLVKPGQLFPDCYEASLYYEKNTRVKQKSVYGKNDSFRYGYCYAIDFVILAVVILYSVSNPLIHFFGMVFFYFRFHLNTYTLAVFHHKEQIFSNLRLILKVFQSISIIIGFWVFLTATSLIFEGVFSNAIILYLYCGFVIYFAGMLSKVRVINDLKTQSDSKSQDIREDIRRWKSLYQHPFKERQYSMIF